MIDFTKRIQTKSGEKVEIKMMDGRGDYPVVGYVGDMPHLVKWDKTGKNEDIGGYRNDWLDLINEKQEKTYWYFIFNDSGKVNGPYRSEDEAIFSSEYIPQDSITLFSKNVEIY